LTPSRAAILGATLPADCNIEQFLKSLGIAKPVAFIPGGGRWTLANDTILRRIQWNDDCETGILEVDATIKRHFQAEINERTDVIAALNTIVERLPGVEHDPAIQYWRREAAPYNQIDLSEGLKLRVESVVANPSAFKDLLAMASLANTRVPNLYGYDRAHKVSPPVTTQPITILDPTAGGGSIPFEALRLGHNVIANELNPVATVILHATLDFPRRFGHALAPDIDRFGQELLRKLDTDLDHIFARVGTIPADEYDHLKQHLGSRHAIIAADFTEEQVTSYLYCRQVTCPHCGGQAPLLNCFWLSKEDGDRSAVRLIVRSKSQVDIETYKISGTANKQLLRELDSGTVDAGRGTCIHCRQVIDGDEIKAQGRGDSPHGTMIDRLYCVVAVRFEPKLKRNGELDTYTTGDRAGEVKTKKIRYFRAPNQRDLDALEISQRTLNAKWDHFERLDLVPTEDIPPGHKTGDEGGAGSGTDKPLKLGTNKWHQMFTSRQLLGHLTLMEGLQNLKPQILEDLGHERGKAVITYLQFAIDKGLDWNSRQTCWIYQRGQVGHTFARHDFGFRWTFGEMIFTGPSSGAAWSLNQIVDAFKSMAELMSGVPETNTLEILNGSGAMMESIADESVDLVVNDPPYYNNVMYSELADFFYVWQKRSLRDVYPNLFSSYLTDKQSEAVANPFRDGSAAKAKEKYERLMREMYAECFRVTKPYGRMVLMFTHKSQDGWETLTQALVNSGWAITATYPVESEFGHSMHIMEQASASSSIFIVCRKRDDSSSEPALWKAFGGRGVQQRIIEEVQQGLVEFEALDLRPVDTMVASYGRALRVLSEKWPVMDGDETVSPIRALNEASRVVAQHQIHKLTEGRLKVEDLTPEAAMAVTLYGIAGLQPIRFDEVLNVARSLGIAIESTTAGYDASGRTIGYVTEATGRRAGQGDDIVGYHAPLVRKGSNLRLAKPEERNERRLASPQHEWDVLQGMLLKYREGDIPVARAYLAEHAEGEQSKIIDLLRVWTKEMDDESLRQEGETILFGLQGA
jgi:adenine-specific DNA methylase